MQVIQVYLNDFRLIRIHGGYAAAKVIAAAGSILDGKTQRHRHILFAHIIYFCSIHNAHVGAMEDNPQFGVILE